MDNYSVNKKDGLSALFKEISFIITIAFTEIAIFYIFMSFLIIEKFDKRLFFLIAIIVLFFYIIKKFHIINDLIRNAYTKYKSFSIFFMVLLLLCTPFLLKNNTYLLHLCIMSGLYLVVVLGLNMVLGNVGMANFAFAAFFGIGAYTSALLTINFNFSFWWGILASIFLSALGGLLIGLATLKSTHIFYALMTIAFQRIFHLLVNNLKFTGGPGGITNIPFPKIGEYSFGSTIAFFGTKLPYQANYYYLLLVAILFFLYIAYSLNVSHTGLAWNAIREDPIAARCQGINIIRGKLEATIIGAIFAGIAGSIYAHYIGFICPESFTFNLSVIFVGINIIGGLGSIEGVVLGSIILSIMPEKIRFLAETRMLFYGIIIILVLMFKPQGIIPEKTRQYNSI